MKASQFKSLHHISYTVSDIERSVAFYRDVMGFTLLHVVHRKHLPSYDAILGHKDIELRIAAFEIPRTNLTLELMQFIRPKPVARPQDFLYIATSHVAYRVDDIEAEYRRIKSAGGDFVSAPAEIHRDGKYIGKAVFLKDPDGILIEPMELAKS